MGLSEFEVNLVFRMSSKAARATERSPISEKKRGTCERVASNCSTREAKDGGL